MKQNNVLQQTKLETCIIILGAVENKQPTTINEVQSEVNLNSAVLKEYLEFMDKHGVVRKVGSRSPVEYATTTKGKTVFRYFQTKTPSAVVSQTTAQEGY